MLFSLAEKFSTTLERAAPCPAVDLDNCVFIPLVCLARPRLAIPHRCTFEHFQPVASWISSATSCSHADTTWDRAVRCASNASMGRSPISGKDCLHHVCFGLSLATPLPGKPEATDAWTGGRGPDLSWQWPSSAGSLDSRSHRRHPRSVGPLQKHYRYAAILLTLPFRCKCCLRIFYEGQLQFDTNLGAAT